MRLEIQPPSYIITCISSCLVSPSADNQCDKSCMAPLMVECVALDTELPGNVRMYGRLYQYCISEMQWSNLDASTDFYFLAVLLLAMLKIYPKIDNAHDWQP